MKQKIAVVAGGYTKEDVVSIRSGNVVAQHIDPEKYEVYKIIITRENWYHPISETEKIEIDKNDFSLILNAEKICFDAVFIIVHGTPGENGLLQAYFEMLQIPYTTCDATTSAITMNKAYCNAILKQFGVCVAPSLHLFKGDPNPIKEVETRIGFPCFVKPNTGGSSIGMSKVNKPEEFSAALEKAFAEDQQVLIERYIKGREFSCGLALINEEISVFPITEIISKKEFFDYEAKYEGMSDEITPASIPLSIAEEVEMLSRKVYNSLHCFGLVRCDFIWEEKSGDLYFLEVNTVPGQSEQSIVPQQVRAMGSSVRALYTDLILESIKRAQTL